MKINHKSLIAGALVVLFTLLMGCSNTVQGFGKDVEQSGEAIQRTAE